MSKIKLNYILKQTRESVLIIKDDWNRELICLFITTDAPGRDTKIAKHNAFLTAYLALLNILSILLLMSRSLIMMRIHAS